VNSRDKILCLGIGGKKTLVHVMALLIEIAVQAEVEENLLSFLGYVAKRRW
jgi:hypothetical protein